MCAAVTDPLARCEALAARLSDLIDSLTVHRAFLAAMLERPRRSQRRRPRAASLEEFRKLRADYVPEGVRQ